MDIFLSVEFLHHHNSIVVKLEFEKKNWQPVCRL
jgi:hypothetical protein